MLLGLPAEILCEVVKFLSYKELFRLRSVCKSLEPTLLDPIIWRKFMIELVDSSRIETITRIAGTLIYNLNISDAILNPHEYELLVCRCPNLERLSISVVYEPSIAYQWKRMISLKIASPKKDCSEALTLLLDYFSIHSPQFTQFSLISFSYSIRIPDKLLTNLILLDLTRSHFAVESLLGRFDRLNNMQELIICETNATDDIISEVALHCAMLKKLDIRGLTTVTDASVNLLSNCIQLNTLFLKGCRRVSEGMVDVLAERIPSLKVVLSPMSKWRHFIGHSK